MHTSHLRSPAVPTPPQPHQPHRHPTRHRPNRATPPLTWCYPNMTRKALPPPTRHNTSPTWHAGPAAPHHNLSPRDCDSFTMLAHHAQVLPYCHPNTACKPHPSPPPHPPPPATHRCYHHRDSNPATATAHTP